MILSLICQPVYIRAGTLEQIYSAAESIFSREPKEIQALRQMDVAQTDEGHQEYYFRQLTEEEQRLILCDNARRVLGVGGEAL